jgi:hypothetical protein
MSIFIIGIDLGKNSCSLPGLDNVGRGCSEASDAAGCSRPWAKVLGVRGPGDAESAFGREVRPWRGIRAALAPARPRKALRRIGKPAFRGGRDMAAWLG